MKNCYYVDMTKEENHFRIIGNMLVLIVLLCVILNTAHIEGLNFIEK